MKQLFILTALMFSACERQPLGQPTTGAPDAVSEMQTSSSKRPAVVPRPQEQAQLDRMILAGYTPHGNHMHAPGVKECPLAQGNEAVM
jgi:hypothetical protein